MGVELTHPANDLVKATTFTDPECSIYFAGCSNASGFGTLLSGRARRNLWGEGADAAGVSHRMVTVFVLMRNVVFVRP